MIVDTGRRDLLLTLFRESMPGQKTQTNEFVRGYIHAMFEDALDQTRDYCHNRRDRYEALHFEGIIDGIEIGLKIAAWHERKGNNHVQQTHGG